MQKNAEKMDLSSCNRLLQVPTGSEYMTCYLTHHMTRTLTLGGSLYPWHSLVADHRVLEAKRCDSDVIAIGHLFHCEMNVEGLIELCSGLRGDVSWGHNR